eukprot:NODE_14_length_42432_cov_0.433799.p16 type:complete len:211 gc:universal NODE_14_length_42432_cov_0.433799:25770-25138(-)
MNSSSESLEGWVGWYVRQTESQLLIDVEEDFYLDKFNLTGLQNIVHFPICYDILTDNSDIQEYSQDAHLILDKSTRHLYGMIHARYVLTAPGMRKIAMKVKSGIYGYCKRYNCPKTPLIPIGMSDKPYVSYVKGYCGHCQDVYHVNSQLDGSYFTSTLPHLLLLSFPDVIVQSRCIQFDLYNFGFDTTTIKSIKSAQLLVKEELDKYWNR